MFNSLRKIYIYIYSWSKIPERYGIGCYSRVLNIESIYSMGFVYAIFFSKGFKIANWQWCTRPCSFFACFALAIIIYRHSLQTPCGQCKTRVNINFYVKISRDLTRFGNHIWRWLWHFQPSLFYGILPSAYLTRPSFHICLLVCSLLKPGRLLPVLWQ